jgi:hypothetical protein
MHITRAAATAAEAHKRQQRIAAAGTLRGRRVEGVAIEHGGAFGPKLETICTKLWEFVHTPGTVHGWQISTTSRAMPLTRVYDSPTFTAPRITDFFVQRISNVARKQMIFARVKCTDRMLRNSPFAHANGMTSRPNDRALFRDQHSRPNTEAHNRASPGGRASPPQTFDTKWFQHSGARPTHARTTRTTFAPPGMSSTSARNMAATHDAAVDAMRERAPTSADTADPHATPTPTTASQTNEDNTAPVTITHDTFNTYENGTQSTTTSQRKDKTDVCNETRD